MRFNFIYVAALVMAFSLAGCNDDLPLPEQGCVTESDSPLRFFVSPFAEGGDDGTRSAEPSDSPEPENDDERKINDFWLFQFNPDGTRLAETEPKY